MAVSTQIIEMLSLKYKVYILGKQHVNGETFEGSLLERTIEQQAHAIQTILGESGISLDEVEIRLNSRHVHQRLSRPSKSVKFVGPRVYHDGITILQMDDLVVKTTASKQNAQTEAQAYEILGNFAPAQVLYQHGDKLVMSRFSGPTAHDLLTDKISRLRAVDTNFYLDNGVVDDDISLRTAITVGQLAAFLKANTMMRDSAIAGTQQTKKYHSLENSLQNLAGQIGMQFIGSVKTIQGKIDDLDDDYFNADLTPSNTVIDLIGVQTELGITEPNMRLGKYGLRDLFESHGERTLAAAVAKHTKPADFDKYGVAMPLALNAACLATNSALELDERGLGKILRIFGSMDLMKGFYEQHGLSSARETAFLGDVFQYINDDKRTEFGIRARIAVKYEIDYTPGSHSGWMHTLLVPIVNEMAFLDRQLSSVSMYGEINRLKLQHTYDSLALTGMQLAAHLAEISDYQAAGEYRGLADFFEKIFRLSNSGLKTSYRRYRTQQVTEQYMGMFQSASAGFSISDNPTGSIKSMYDIAHQLIMVDPKLGRQAKVFTDRQLAYCGLEEAFTKLQQSDANFLIDKDSLRESLAKSRQNHGFRVDDLVVQYAVGDPHESEQFRGNDGNVYMYSLIGLTKNTEIQKKVRALLAIDPDHAMGNSPNAYRSASYA